MNLCNMFCLLYHVMCEDVVVVANLCSLSLSQLLIKHLQMNQKLVSLSLCVCVFSSTKGICCILIDIRQVLVVVWYTRFCMHHKLMNYLPHINHIISECNMILFPFNGFHTIPKNLHTLSVHSFSFTVIYFTWSLHCHIESVFFFVLLFCYYEIVALQRCTSNCRHHRKMMIQNCAQMQHIPLTA